jgi:uncharacterized protein
MKKIIYVVILNIWAIALCFSQNNIPKDISGKWMGKLSVQGMQLRVVFNLKKENDKITASLDSPDQGAKNIPVGNVWVNRDSLQMEIPSVMGSFEGTFTNDTILDGKWIQGGMTLPLVLKKQVAEPSKIVIKSPYYDAIDVKILNAKDTLVLAGTLTIPKNAQNCPAVVLVTGSGPQNRDEEVMGQKSFYRIADYLSSHGIAVLRFDDRGVNESTGNFQTATTFDFVTDAEVAVAFLKLQKGINPKQIGIIGHSEGGLVAPIAASRDKNVNYIIMLAGPGISGEDVLFTQTEAIFLASGFNADTIKQINALNRKIFSIVKNQPDNKLALIEIRSVLDSLSFPKETKDMLYKQSVALISPWFRSFLSLNPVNYLKKVTCPVLALTGSRDLQVLPGPNNKAIESALMEAKNKNYTVRELAGYNHMFQPSETGLMNEYGNLKIPSMDDKVLEIITHWIKNLSLN